MNKILFIGGPWDGRRQVVSFLAPTVAVQELLPASLCKASEVEDIHAPVKVPQSRMHIYYRTTLPYTTPEGVVAVYTLNPVEDFFGMLIDAYPQQQRR